MSISNLGCNPEIKLIFLNIIDNVFLILEF